MQIRTMFTSRFILFARAILLFILFQTALGQVTIKVLKVPKNTPPGASIYAGGTFNNWNSGDPNLRLMPQPDGTYSITFPRPLKYFEFKFTRGEWTNVEGSENGNTISNRVYTYKGSPDTLKTTIDSWIDLEILKITVTNIPSNTPDDAPIFITGPFNNWNPADPDHKLERLQNGTYQFVLHNSDTLSFKFTRGSFQSMEADKNGKPITSRLLIPFQLKSQNILYSIEGWEDLSEDTADFFRIILILAAILGLFIAFALNMIRNPKKEANNFLIAFLVLISGMIFIRILLYDQYFVYQAPKLVLFPLFLLFAVNPLLYIYSKNVFHPYGIIVGARQYLFFLIPLVILLIALLPYITTNNDQLVLMLLNGGFNNQLAIVSGLGIVYNFYYLQKYFKMLKGAKQSDGSAPKQQSYYYYIVLLISIGVIITLVFTIARFISLGFLGLPNAQLSSEFCIKLCWFGLCLYPFVVTWFAILYPEIFSFNFEIDKGKSTETLNTIKIKLDELMENKRPFLDPDLTLNDLAKMLQSNVHTLSKVINESNSMNFYDFINSYRIGEFKKRIETGQHKTKTIIAIANETGFKSKTTFNRTFKKINGVTPREYLTTIKI